MINLLDYSKAVNMLSKRGLTIDMDQRKNLDKQTNGQTDKQRISEIDIAKGIGIICVVYAHIGLPGSRLITYFHMPLFFLLSGYLFSEKDNFKSTFIKKIKHLYIPFLKFELIFILLHNLFYKVHIYSEISNVPIIKYSGIEFIKKLCHIMLFDNTELLLAPLWFFTALFFVTIMYKAIDIYSNKFKNNSIIINILVLFFFVLGFILTRMGFQIDLTWNFKYGVSVILNMILFYHTGRLIKSKGLIKYTNSIVVSIVALIILVLTYKIFGLSVDVRANEYSNKILFVVNAFCGIYIVMFASNLLNKVVIKNIFIYLGKKSLWIMCLHIFIFKLVDVFQYYFINKNLTIAEVSNFTSLPNLSFILKICYLIIALVIPLIIEIINRKFSVILNNKVCNRK